jgi:predicted phosphodiesterase
LRTLITSDFHLGNRAGHDVLTRRAARGRLLEALEGVDRLVLLGDIAELVTRSPRRALAVAEPVLRELGRRTGGHCETIVVPGNHDRPLVRAWAGARGRDLGLSDEVPAQASPALSRIVEWLGPWVTVRYPGVWIDERTYATHGHYLDDHLVPAAPTGLPRGRLRHRPVPPAHVFDYDRRRVRSQRRGEARLGQRVERALGAAATRVERAVMPWLPHLLMRSGLTPITAALADLQARHAALPALSLVLSRLQVAADTVIFGHIHRRGPLDDEPLADWRAPAGPQLFNTGSWLYEPPLVEQARPPHPYWPGGAILIDGDAPPRSVGLLDDLSQAQLLGRDR